MRALAVSFAMLLLPASVLSAPPAHVAGEQVKVGFIFATGGAKLREAPDGASKSVAVPPVGTRLVFRKVIDTGAGPSWYFAEHPSGKAGWIAKAETSEKRPTPPPPAKPIKVVDSGVGLARPSSAQTAAARGLSPMAKQYAEKKQDFKDSVDQFLTLEKSVDAYFSDPHDENGNYEDVTVAGRKTKAEQFKSELR